MLVYFANYLPFTLILRFFLAAALFFGVCDGMRFILVSLIYELLKARLQQLVSGFCPLSSLYGYSY